MQNFVQGRGEMLEKHGIKTSEALVLSDCCTPSLLKEQQTYKCEIESRYAPSGTLVQLRRYALVDVHLLVAS